MADGGSTDDGAAAQASTFRDVTEGVRRRTDVTAKTFGGLATTALSAVGISKFADVFPYPPGERLAVAGLAAGFASMAFVVAFFTIRLWRVSEPIVASSNAGEIETLDTEERTLVDRVYDKIARLNQAPSLAAYEARAHRLERIADRTSDEPRAKKLRDKAAAIVGDVVAAETRAIMLVVRRRATHAVGDKKAAAAYAAFVVGLVLFALGSDRLDSERNGRVAVAKACGDARAVADQLPKICAGAKTPATATAASVASDAVAALATAVGRCEAARKKHARPDPCAPLQDALAAAIAR